jgi:hypothetical protein
MATAGTAFARDLLMTQNPLDTERPVSDAGLEDTPSTASTDGANGRERAASAAEPEETPRATGVRGGGTSEPWRMDRIAVRAYELYERRGGEHGRELADWLEAERQIDGTDEDGGTGPR